MCVTRCSWLTSSTAYVLPLMALRVSQLQRPRNRHLPLLTQRGKTRDSVNWGLRSTIAPIGA